MSSFTPLRIVALVLVLVAIGCAVVSVVFPVQWSESVDKNRRTIDTQYTTVGTPFLSNFDSTYQLKEYNFTSGKYEPYYNGYKTVYLYGTTYKSDSETYRIDTPKDEVAYELQFKITSYDVSSSGSVYVSITDKNYGSLARATWEYQSGSQYATATVCRGSYYVTFSSSAIQSLYSVELRMRPRPGTTYASFSFCDQTPYVQETLSAFLILCVILAPLSCCLCCCAIVLCIKGAPKDNCHQPHAYNTHVQDYNGPQPVYNQTPAYGQPQPYGQPNPYGSPQPVYNQPHPEQGQPQYYGQGYAQPQAYGQPQVAYGQVQPAYVSTNEKQPLVEKTIE